MQCTAEILRLEAARKWVAGSPDGFETLIEALRCGETQGNRRHAALTRFVQRPTSTTTNKLQLTNVPVGGVACRNGRGKSSSSVRAPLD